MEKQGATIERGIVTEKSDAGYKVQSYTEDGITTSFLPAIDGGTHNTGDKVYFFMFEDGHGAIISAFE